MDSNDLTREQLDDLAEKARRLRAFMQAMKTRMEQTGFPVKDRLFKQTTAAFNAMHEMHMSLHYLSCEEGRDS